VVGKELMMAGEGSYMWVVGMQWRIRRAKIEAGSQKTNKRFRVNGW
jgi:hypothetical protein